ncbi:MAG TPA: VapC toxin family PIN domain ribonuclease, partial [Dehalococcoidia bacterium]|nr:VapC toxin family PIN domain ribonuclease [Dehalococcoidia bacterium]
DDSLLDDAADLDFPGLRSLDAVHLASARKLRSDLNRMVAYDRRLTLAAEALGITVDAPGT